MGPFPSSRGNKYILVAIEYLGKWVEEKALPTNDARVVCKFLKLLFARFGTPRAIISDHGENRASWSDKLEDALWAFRTAFKTPIGCTPYKLVYGKACHLPIELEHKAYWALKHCNFDLKTAGDHRKVQMNELNELRDQAYENSLIYKEKTKKIHDSKIKNRVFNVGDRVLLFNSRLKIFSGKLKTRWTGPFTVTQVFPYGTVELSSTNGPNFKDYPDYEDSRARGFVQRSLDLHQIFKASLVSFEQGKGAKEALHSDPRHVKGNSHSRKDPQGILLVLPEVFDSLRDVLKDNGAEIILCCDPSRLLCVFSYAKENKMLPKQGFTCCLAMDGVKILATGFEIEKKLREYIDDTEDYINIQLVRVGHPARLLPQVLDNTLHAQIVRGDNSSLANDIRKEMKALNGKLLKAKDKHQEGYTEGAQDAFGRRTQETTTGCDRRYKECKCRFNHSHRCRGLNSAEAECGLCVSDVSQAIAGKPSKFNTFDKMRKIGKLYVLGPTAQQKDLYKQAVFPIENEVLEGFNCTIFAFGQTETRKTYTMKGECKRAKAPCDMAWSTTFYQNISNVDECIRLRNNRSASQCGSGFYFSRH
ncbi:reverse transcriptase domain-containing protein [Tanacetum coccineum]